MPDETMSADLSFEDALKRLEEIVHRLETGDVPLDKSIELYSEGEKLRALCEARLTSAQARIEAIQRDQLSPEGRPTAVRPFDAE